MIDSQVDAQKKTSVRSAHIVRETIATLAWLYFIINTFIYEIDAVTLRKFSVLDSHWLPWYKLLFVGIVCLAILKYKGIKQGGKQILYVIFYPFIFVFMRIGKTIIKNPEYGIPLIPLILYWIKHIRLRILMLSMALLAATVILVSRTPFVIYVCMSVLLIYMLSSYAFQIKKTIKVSRSMPSMGDKVRNSWAEAMSANARKEYEALQQMDVETEEYSKKRVDNVKFILTLNAVHLWAADKLKKVFDRHIIDFALVASVGTSFVVTAAVFALCYRGIQTIDPNSFSQQGNLWRYVFLSFNAIFQNSIDAFQPMSQLGQMLFLLEEFCGYLILGVFFFLFLSVMREGYRKGASELVEKIKGDRRVYEQQLKEYYALDPEEALAIIDDGSAGARRTIDFIRLHW